jgi:hypothetical protein
MTEAQKDATKSIQTSLSIVKRIIEAGERDKNYLVFVARHGEIDVVSATSGEEAFIYLNEEAKARSGGPYFEILSITGGTVIIDDNQCVAYTDQLLVNAIQEALDNHREFYAERAKEFGASAYPTL